MGDQANIVVKGIESLYKFGGAKREDFEIFRFRLDQVLFKANKICIEELEEQKDTDSADVTRNKRDQFMTIAGRLSKAAERVAMKHALKKDPKLLWDELEKTFGDAGGHHRSKVTEMMENFQWETVGRSIRGLRDYTLKYQALLHRTPDVEFPDWMILEKICKIVPPLYQAITAPVVVKNYRCDITEVLDQLQQWEDLQDLRGGDTSHDQTAGKAFSAHHFRKQTPGAKFPKKRYGQKFSSSCYNCGGDDHIRPECTQPTKTCSTCGKQGHMQKFCADANRLEGFLQRRRATDGGQADARANATATSKSYEKGHSKSKKSAGDRSLFTATTAGPLVVKTTAPQTIKSVSTEPTSVAFLIDSGADNHFTAHREWLMNWREATGKVRVADKSVHDVTGVGDIHLQCMDSEGRPHNTTITDVQLVPTLDPDMNLLSVGRLNEMGHGCILEDIHAELPSRLVVKGGQKELNLRRTGKLVFLDGMLSSNLPSLSAVKTGPSPQDEEQALLVHRRLGHIGLERMKQAAKTSTGIKIPVTVTKIDCNECGVRKSEKLPIAKHTMRTTKPGKVIHSDLWGKARVMSAGGKKYAISFVDEATRFTRVYFMKIKSETTAVLRQFVRDTNTDPRVQIRVGPGTKFQFDGGKNYLSQETTDYLAEIGATRQTSEPFSPGRHGFVERRWKELITTALCLLDIAGMEAQMWCTAVGHAAYIINRAPTKALPGNMSPYEAATGQPPDLRHLRVFGSKVYAHVDQSQRLKNDPKADVGYYIGHSNLSEALRVWVPQKHKVRECRDVKLVEVPMTKSNPTNDAGTQGEAEHIVVSEADETGVQPSTPTPAPATPPAPSTAQLKAPTNPDDTTVFDIEYLADSRGRAGQRQYLVKWKDYPDAERTWEPEQHLRGQVTTEVWSTMMEALKNRKTTPQESGEDGDACGEARACSSAVKTTATPPVPADPTTIEEAMASSDADKWDAATL